MNHYTKAEVVGILRESHEAVTEADVPDDLRAQAFAAAVNALAAKTVTAPAAVLGAPLGRMSPNLRERP